MSKMTKEQIIKALEDWLNIIREDQQRCLKTGASYDVVEEMHGTYIDTLVNALDLINRQKKNAEGLLNAVKFLNEKLSSAEAEIDTLVKEMEGDTE